MEHCITEIYEMVCECYRRYCMLPIFKEAKEDFAKITEILKK